MIAKVSYPQKVCKYFNGSSTNYTQHINLELTYDEYHNYLSALTDELESGYCKSYTRNNYDVIHLNTIKPGLNYTKLTTARFIADYFKIKRYNRFHNTTIDLKLIG